MTRRRNKTMTQAAKFYTLAVEMLVAVLAPVFIGLWLDAKTGKEPWFTVGGMLLGGAAAMRSAYRALKESMKDNMRGESPGEPDKRGHSR